MFRPRLITAVEFLSVWKSIVTATSEGFPASGIALQKQEMLGRAFSSCEAIADKIRTWVSPPDKLPFLRFYAKLSALCLSYDEQQRRRCTNRVAVAPWQTHEGNAGVTTDRQHASKPVKVRSQRHMTKFGSSTNSLTQTRFLYRTL